MSAENPTSWFRSLASAPAGPARTSQLEELEEFVKSGRIRESGFGPDFYQELLGLLLMAFSWRGRDTQADVWIVERTFLAITKVPEFDPRLAEPHIPEHWLRALASRTDGTVMQEEWPLIRDLYLWVYGYFPEKRPTLRALIGRTLRSASHFVHKSAPVGPLLEVLVPIIKGFKTPFGSSQRGLLTDILLPLHKTNEWLQWDRQTPLLGMFHKELVHCMLLILEKQPMLAPKAVEATCGYFPSFKEANTPKELLIAYEVSQLVNLVPADKVEPLLPTLLLHMTRMLSSHNAQPIQAILQFWKDAHLEHVFHTYAKQVIPAVLPALLRGGEPFWNPTVNRMTTLVLEKMEASDPQVFAETAESLWGPGKQRPAYLTARAAQAAAEKLAQEEAAKAESAKPGQQPDVSSLKYCLGGWKPPGSSAGAGGSKPPLTATGVAPWAKSSGAKPPVTATGVAPWAFKGGPPAGRVGPLSGMGAGLAASQEEDKEKSGLEQVHEYCKVLCPDTSAGGADGSTRSWEAALTAETPTLLPSLKFHQLVFGPEDLASGAFSVVRYARTIVKDKTQSDWPEYAVKVINTETIQEHGYEASVNREIVILKMLSHPNIARMVSAFRWREGAYLVLEYAAKGDLHTILVQQGPLPEATAQFFIGETIAALSAIHEIGFVYGDLKPENIVITSTSHAKLADFGGCRPVTEEARHRTHQSLLRRLRDGDWRARDRTGGEDPEAEDIEEEDVKAMATAEETRVEGTILYCPPEVLHGNQPTQAADAWALGCVMYQLMVGKPPMWLDEHPCIHDCTEEELISCIVSFKVDEGNTLNQLSPAAGALVGRLLERQVEKRLNVEGSAHDPFFDGVDVFRLYAKPRGPEIAAGQRKSAEGDERWQKRQFSKIWSAMPSAQDYAFPPPKRDAKATAQGPAASFEETSVECGASFCDESMVDRETERELCYNMLHQHDDADLEGVGGGENGNNRSSSSNNRNTDSKDDVSGGSGGYGQSGLQPVERGVVDFEDAGSSACRFCC